MQRGHFFALVDEADSILIDEARTPLIVGLTQPHDAASVQLLRWSQRAAERLRDREYYHWESATRSACLTDAGCRRVLLLPKPRLLATVETNRLYGEVENALTGRVAFQRDRDYVVANGEVVIVDESTGRMMQGRKWQDGLHQAVCREPA